MIDLNVFEKDVLVEAIGCPITIVKQAIVETIIEFAEGTWIFNRAFNQILTSTDINTDINDYVDFNVTEYVIDKNPIAIPEFRINGEEWVLKYMLLENETNYIEYLRENNQKLFSFPDPSTLRIHELESLQEIFLRIVYKPVYGITEINEEIYYDWYGPIIAGAKVKLQLMPNQPWTNREMAAYYLGQFKSGMSKAKAKFQRSFTDKSGAVKWRTFGE